MLFYGVNEMAKTVQIICTSVFKSADTDAFEDEITNNTTKREITKKMIELINQLEKNKETSSPMR